MVEFFKALLDAGILTAAFIIGAFAVALSIVGSVKAVIELSGLRAIILACFGVILMLFGAVGYFISASPSAPATTLGVVEVTPTPIQTPTPAPVQTTTPTRTPTAMPTVSPPASPCPYQADTNEDTITRLIHAESEAVIKEDITIIQVIFAKDAGIRDAVSGERWNDPIIRYETLFREVDFTYADHSEVQPAGPGITGNVAWFTSGGKGSYVTKDGQPGSYNNPSGSDHWTFGKNSAGCWIITNFTFNASHIPFPP